MDSRVEVETSHIWNETGDPSITRRRSFTWKKWKHAEMECGTGDGMTVMLG